MPPEYTLLLTQLKQQPKLIKQVATKLKKLRKGAADSLIHQLHTEAFKQIDCLQCANCCSTTGPLLTTKDINRLAKTVRQKPALFMEDYLRIDEDKDYVFKAMPCPFLAENNHCQVYDTRPKACREYPHTDRVNQLGILKITQKNAGICPAVAFIFLRLKEQLE